MAGAASASSQQQGQWSIKTPDALRYLPLRTRLRDGTLVEVDSFRERSVRA